MSKEQRFDIHQHITDQIVAAIERGAGEFRLPWALPRRRHRAPGQRRVEEALPRRQRRRVLRCGRGDGLRIRTVGYLQANFGAYSQQVERARQLWAPIPVFDSRLGRCEDCRRGLDDLNTNRIRKERRQNLKQRGTKRVNFRSQNRRRSRRSRQCPFNQRHRRDVVPATDLDLADLCEPAVVELMLIDLAMIDDPGFANGTERGVIGQAPRIDLGPSGP